jgi:hypothetical protein
MQSNKEFRSGSRGTGAGNVGILLGGIGIGAALMYLFDPDRGRGRRARLGDQIAGTANRLGDAAGSKARDLRNRAQGIIHEAGSLLPGGGKNEPSSQNNEQQGMEGATRTASAGGR